MELGDKGFMKGDETGRSARASAWATGLSLSCYCPKMDSPATFSA